MRVGAVLAVAFAVAAAGCGSSGNANPSTQTNSTTAKTTSDASAATLKRAAREALLGNYKLSSYVLWHNRVPAWARQSTDGPALAGLRSAAAQRKRQGIRIRPVSGQLRI